MLIPNNPLVYHPMDSTYFAHSKLLWTPVQPQISASEVLRRQINRKHGLQLSGSKHATIGCYANYSRLTPAEDYHDLHKYSIEDYTFWLDLWEFLGIISSIPPQKVCNISTKFYIEVLNKPCLEPHSGTWKATRSPKLVPWRTTQLC